jgi:hypothetical protein
MPLTGTSVPTNQNQPTNTCGHGLRTANAAMETATTAMIANSAIPIEVDWGCG